MILKKLRRLTTKQNEKGETMAEKEGEKRISEEKIRGVEASFKAFTDTLPTSTENGLIEAPVTTNFQTATEKVKSSMESLTETVQSLDVYLNSVADTFVEMDLAIATGIEQGLNRESEMIGPVQATKTQVKPIGKDNMYAKPPMDVSVGNEATTKSSKYDKALPGADKK
jgi:hypothetical protein